MGFPWRNVFKIGITVLDTVIPGVRTIETIAQLIPGLKGKAKQDAVVELVKQSLEASEQFMGRDLAEDAEVEKATRGVIDAVVSLQNIIAQKAAAKA